MATVETRDKKDEIDSVDNRSNSGISFSIENILTRKTTKLCTKEVTCQETKLKSDKTCFATVAALDLRKNVSGIDECDRISEVAVKQINKNREKYCYATLSDPTQSYFAETSNNCVTNNFCFVNGVGPFGGSLSENGLANLNGYLHRHFLTHGSLSGFSCVARTSEESKADDSAENTSINNSCKARTEDSEHDTSFEAVESDSEISVVSVEEKTLSECDNIGAERQEDPGQVSYAGSRENTETASRSNVSVSVNKTESPKGMT